MKANLLSGLLLGLAQALQEGGVLGLEALAEATASTAVEQLEKLSRVSKTNSDPHPNTAPTHARIRKNPT
jgi:hypothetical protein